MSAAEAAANETIFVVDWDGVVCEAIWPAWGDFIPGAVDGLRELLVLGRVRINSSRINPYQLEFDGFRLRDPLETDQDIATMRAMLDAEGLEAVEIHTTHGKPTGHYYIDDRAIEFTGSWEPVIERVRGELT